MTIPFTDLLVRPINVGDKVLVKGYYSTTANEIAEVLAINKASISVNLTESYWVKPHQYEMVNGKWQYTDYGERGTRLIRKTRVPSECLVVNELLQPSEQARKDFQQKLIDTPASDLIPSNLSSSAFEHYKDRINRVLRNDNSWRIPQYELDSNLSSKKEEIQNELNKQYPEYSI